MELQSTTKLRKIGVSQMEAPSWPCVNWRSHANWRKTKSYLYGLVQIGWFSVHRRGLCTYTTHARWLTHLTPQHQTPNNSVRPDTHNPISFKRSVQPTHKHITKTLHTPNPNTKSIPHTTTNKLTINLKPNIASHPYHHPTKVALAKTLTALLLP